MEQNKINYTTPICYALCLGFLVSAFMHSCQITKAGITRLAPRTEVISHKPYIRSDWSVKDSVKPLNSVKINPDHTDVKIPEVKVISDTVNYNRLILSNQQLSLDNERKIIEMLVNKERENKILKVQNVTLAKKSEITQAERTDAVSMQAIWETGKMLLTVGVAIIVLLIIQILVMLWWFKKKACNVIY